MLLIYCPYCEEYLPEIEFHCEGEAHIERPTNMADISDEDFEKFFFIRENQKGIVYERWRHVHGCGRFFNVVRHSVSDKIIMTYKAGEPRPKLTKKQIEAALPPAKSTPANDPIWIEDSKGGKK
ncbi:MAG: sarcosine oxidase subunit delta [Pseudomonadota bacterium]